MSANLMSLARSGGKFLKLFGDRKMMKTMPTARDYVQDGLVAMWDGIENAGWGVHDQNATTCVDIVGGVHAFRGISEPMAFVVGTGSQFFDIDTTDATTIEWLWRDSGTTRNCQIYTHTKSNSLRYQVSDVRTTYTSYQIRYWNGAEQVSIYPMNKTVRAGAVTYSDGVFNVYGDGLVRGTYSDASASESTYFSASKETAFNCIRIYSRALTADEIAANYAIDKARFNLPD